jgi:hypothetical protein
MTLQERFKWLRENPLIGYATVQCTVDARTVITVPYWRKPLVNDADTRKFILFICIVAYIQ